MSSNFKEVLKFIGYLVVLIMGASVTLTRLNGDISFFPLPIAIIFLIVGLVGIFSSVWNLLVAKGKSLMIFLALSLPIIILSVWLFAKKMSHNQLAIDAALIEAPPTPGSSINYKSNETKATSKLESISKPISADSSIPSSLGYWEKIEAEMDKAIASGQKIEPGDYEEIRTMAAKERDEKQKK